MNTHLTSLLAQLSMELKAQSLWQTHQPSESKLASTLPFAVDRLEPHEWLQWVFIDKMQSAIELGQVPQGFSIEPYFAEAWKNEPSYQKLLAIICEIDEACR